MKKRAFVLAGLLAFAAGAYATEHAANVYRTHKLTRTSVLFTCEDEHEPRVKKLDNATMIIVSCEQDPK